VIVRHDGDKILADCAALFVHFGRRFSPDTIRNHCPVDRVDLETGHQLYDLELAEEVMVAVRSRARRRKPSGGST
jgi:hypothetical protein